MEGELLQNLSPTCYMSFASLTHKARLSLCPCIASSSVLVFQHATALRALSATCFPALRRSVAHPNL